MRLLFLASILALGGCAAGSPHTQFDGGPDAQFVWPDSGTDAGVGDAGSIDASSPDAGSSDAGSVDGGSTDAGHDGGSNATDAGTDASTPIDAGSDAGSAAIDGGTCGSISAGDTLVFDGIDDAAEYPTSQVMTPGATLQPWDVFGLSWDADYLYVTMVSSAFAADEYKPMHVYVEAAGTLGAAAEGAGKEYGGLTPRFRFSPTHLIAVRRTSDSGTGGPYNGIYSASSSWTDRVTPLVEGADYWISSTSSTDTSMEMDTISVRVPWTALGCPSQLRLSAHVVNADFLNEWKDLVPASAQPWSATDAGGFYEITLSGDPAISGWTTR